MANILRTHTPHAIAYTPAQEDHRCGLFPMQIRGSKPWKMSDAETLNCPEQLWNDANQVDGRTATNGPIRCKSRWCVAIQTYNDGVPAHEVAAFLINSAEWEEKCGIVCRQSYYQSFIDLKQAQTMLEDIRSEDSPKPAEALN